LLTDENNLQPFKLVSFRAQYLMKKLICIYNLAAEVIRSDCNVSIDSVTLQELQDSPDLDVMIIKLTVLLMALQVLTFSIILLICENSPFIYYLYFIYCLLVFILQTDYTPSTDAISVIKDYKNQFMDQMKLFREFVNNTSWPTLMTIFRTFTNQRMVNFGYFKSKTPKSPIEIVTSVSPNFIAFCLLVIL
jgi:hypothetical protein